MEIKLGEIFKISSGGTPSKSHNEYYADGNVKWVKTGDLKQRYLYETEDYITEDGLKNSSAKMYENGTVLIAMYGATIGATSILKVDACTNQACAAFPRDEQVIPEYLYYFFRSKKKQFVKDGVGGAQPNISAGYLKNVTFNLLGISKQKEIVSVLDKIETIIECRKEQLRCFDELIKSRFIEMFGDPITNSKELPLIQLGKACNMKAGKGIKACDIIDDFEEGMYPCYGGNGLRGYVKNYTHDGAIPLIGRQGALCGNVQYVEGRFYATEHAVVTQPKIKLNTCWLFIMLREMNLNRLATGAAQPGLNVSTLIPLEVINPPIELQDQFAAFVQQVDKLKFEAQKSLNEMESLFDSLMQEYFG